MKRERAEVCRLTPRFEDGLHVASCVHACLVSRRTVEVTWDAQKKQLVFSIVRPITKRVAAVADLGTKRSA